MFRRNALLVMAVSPIATSSSARTSAPRSEFYQKLATYETLREAIYEVYESRDPTNDEFEEFSRSIDGLLRCPAPDATALVAKLEVFKHEESFAHAAVTQYFDVIIEDAKRLQLDQHKQHFGKALT